MECAVAGAKLDGRFPAITPSGNPAYQVSGLFNGITVTPVSGTQNVYQITNPTVMIASTYRPWLGPAVIILKISAVRFPDYRQRPLDLLRGRIMPANAAGFAS